METKLIKNNENTKGFAVGFLTGSISGLLISLLYSPGNVKRSKIKLNGERSELFNDNQEYLEKAKKEFSKVIQKQKVIS